MTITAIDLPMQEIAQFCDRWQVIEFTLQSLVITQLICYFLQSARCIYAVGQPDLEKIES